MASIEKHFQVHWSNGMQVSKDHFLQSENSMIHLAHSTGIHGLSPYNYGVLPTNSPTEKSYDLRLVSNRLELMTCSAITPSGIPIKIPAYDGHLVDCPADVSGSQGKKWAVVLKVDPFERNLINESEVGTGQMPLAIPGYQLITREVGENHQSELGGHELVVGWLVSDGMTIQRDETYYPPCSSLRSHEQVLSEHKALVEKLEKGVSHCFIILGHLNKESEHEPQLAESIRAMVTHILPCITDFSDQFRLTLKFQPPVFSLIQVVKIARALDNALKTLPRENNEELRILNYLSDAGIIDIGGFQRSMQDLLSCEYHHDDLRLSFSKMQSFVQILVEDLLAKLSSNSPYKWKKIDGGRMVIKKKDTHVID